MGSIAISLPTKIPKGALIYHNGYADVVSATCSASGKGLADSVLTMPVKGSDEAW